jgi:hypothetical protein
MKKATLIVDFDDTLVKTGARVKVIPSDGKEFYLTPAEFAVYEKEEDDRFDYSEFNQLIDPKPVERYVALVKKALKTPSVEKIVILTARGHTKPISVFLRSQGITNGIVIAALESGDPQMKARYIEKHLQSGHSRILFIDDSKKNVDAVQALQQKYPNAKIVTHHVKRDSHSTTKNTTHSTNKEPNNNKPSASTDVLNKKIRNPKTKRDILVKTALGYDKSSPVYQQAQRLITRK